MPKPDPYAVTGADVLTDLLAACWDIEDSGGGWNGGDVVDIVTGMLDTYGFNMDHPRNTELGQAMARKHIRGRVDAGGDIDGIDEDDIDDHWDDWNRLRAYARFNARD